MSILYCTIPHFAAALTRQDPPLILVGPEDRVLDASPEVAACGVIAGIPARIARVRCPEARILDADIAGCREAHEAVLQLLEQFSPSVEPHGWGTAYVDLGDLARDRASAVTLGQECGRAVRHGLGDALQPALGWDTGKFTAQAAARRTRPGHLLAVPTADERRFLDPLPVGLLPLAMDVLQRLCFLGLRTLGQYAALSPAAVFQQFGRPGMRAHRYARGEDDRPVVPRWQAPKLAADHEFESPVADWGRLAAATRRMATPMLAELEGRLQACGQLRLTARFDDGSVQERIRTFLVPTSAEPLVLRALEQLLDKMRWAARDPLIQGTAPPFGGTGITALSIAMEQIQDVVIKQLTLFPGENEREHKLERIQRYLTVRFGTGRLWKAALAHRNAPLPEWRVTRHTSQPSMDSR
jgi:protein ImuB